MKPVEACSGLLSTGARLGRGSHRAAWRARWQRLRLVTLVVVIHALFGVLGRLIGLAGEAAVGIHGSILMVALGLANDGLEAGRVAVPIALVSLILPAHWYRSFACWMLTGLVCFGAIAVSIALAVERARGAVTGTFADLVYAAAAPGSLWLQHPFAAALLVASLGGALLLGPVRRAAYTALQAHWQDA